jgi:hypothetical protein
MRASSRLAVLLSLVLLAPVLEARLVFEATELKLAPGFADERSEAVFVFTNQGEKPITISQVNASCGCTVPTLAQRTFASGERGEITALYNIGERQGLNRSQIVVRTEAPDSAVHTLASEVNIPVAIQALPRVVNWRVGDAPEPKVIEVAIHPQAGLKLKGVGGVSEEFSVELLPGPTEGRHQIVVTPTSTANRQRGTFTLEFEEPPARPSQIFAFVF